MREPRTPWLDRTVPVPMSLVVGTMGVLVANTNWFPDAVQGFGVLTWVGVLFIRPGWLWLERKIDAR